MGILFSRSMTLFTLWSATHSDSQTNLSKATFIVASESFIPSRTCAVQSLTSRASMTVSPNLSIGRWGSPSAMAVSYARISRFSWSWTPLSDSIILLAA